VPAGNDRGACRWPQGAHRAGRWVPGVRRVVGDLLRDCARRGMRAPVLAVGDGALGFWNALAEVFPQAREGRCWFHKTANVLAALPRSAHPGAKKALAEIWGAEDKAHAQAAVKAFKASYGAKFPKATAKITDDAEELLAFYGYPCEHWVHLRTTNPIESTFATVRHRTKVTKGPGLPGSGPGDGVQADRVSPGPLARRQSTPPHCPGPRRRDLYERQTHRAAQRGHPARSRLNDLDPQVLTIAPICRSLCQIRAKISGPQSWRRASSMRRLASSSWPVMHLA